MKQLSGIDWYLRRGTCLVQQMDGAAVDWRLKCGGVQSRPINERCDLSFIPYVLLSHCLFFLSLLFVKVCLSLSLHDHVSPSTGDRRHFLCSLAVIIRSKTHWLTRRQTFGREEKRSTERVRWFKRDGKRKLQTLSRAHFQVRGSRGGRKDVLRILMQLNALQLSLWHLVHLQPVTAHTTAGQHQNHGMLVALHPCVVASTSTCVHRCAQPATQL